MIVMMIKRKKFSEALLSTIGIFLKLRSPVNQGSHIHWFYEFPVRGDNLK